jgi:signal peptidase I
MSVGAMTGRHPVRRGMLQRSLERLSAIGVPAVGALLVVRYLWPSALAGARGGLTGLAGSLGERQPLFVGVGVFIVLAEVGRYWRRHFTTARLEGTYTPADAAVPGRKRRLLAGLALVAVGAYVMRSSVVAAYRVVGPSMLPTLEMSDRVLVNRLAYAIRLPVGKKSWVVKTPRRGDLVVFSARGLAGDGGPESIVKRVIGVPGDRVGFNRGSIVINDVPIAACDAGPYVNLMGNITVRGRLVVEFLGDSTYLTVRKALDSEFGPYTVQPGEVFVIGDNRGMSTDSRVWSEGHGTGVPIDALDGKVSRVLLGARPDGRLDFSRLFAPPLGLEVRLPGIDMRVTQERIGKCLERHRNNTLPDPLGRQAPAPAPMLTVPALE